MADEIDVILQHIVSRKQKHVSYGLKKLHSLLKKEKAKYDFVAKDGLDKLIVLLEEHGLGLRTCASSSHAGTNEGEANDGANDIVELVLWCLVKLSIKNNFFVKKFEELNGLTLIEKILAQEPHEGITKRSCTLILHVAESRIACQGIVLALANLLPKYAEEKCAITILRTLWSICQNGKLVSIVTSSNGFASIISLLASDQHRLVKSSLKVLHRFLKIANDEEGVSLRLLEFNGLQLLLSLMQKDLGDEDHRLVFGCLSYMIRIPKIRALVCGTNFIEICAEELSSDVRSEKFKNAFLSLCLCAMEAVNRSKMRTTGALQKLVGLLGEPKFSRFHFQLVSTFVCFLFDDLSLDVMVRCGLLSHLQLYLAWITNLRLENKLDDFPKVYLMQNVPLSPTANCASPVSADGSFANIFGARGPFQDVMLILAKLSQTKAIRFMVSRSCIITLLNYLRTSDKFDSRADKVLYRITEDALFFELILKLDLVQSIYFQLNTGYRAEDLEKVFNDEMLSSIHDSSLLAMNTSVISFNELMKTVAKKLSQGNCSGKSDIAKSASGDDKLDKKSERRMSYCHQRCAKSLLGNLTRHAESSFGQGVLTHVLLSDSTDLKLAFTIGYSYLSRSSRCQKKIYKDMKGLQLLLDIISEFPGDHNKLCDVFLALSALAKSLGIIVNGKAKDKDTNDWDIRWRLYEDDYFGLETKRRKLDEKSTDSGNHKCCLFSSMFCTHYNRQNGLVESDMSCGEKSKQSNDSCFLLEHCIKIFVNREMISKSPVFGAMLSDNFVDSSLPYVKLQDVHASSFLILLHHIYGCCVDFVTLKCIGECSFNGEFEITETADDSDGVSVNTSEEASGKIQGSSENNKVIQKRSTELVNERIKDTPVSISIEDSSEHPLEPRCIYHCLTKEQRICLIADLLRISDRFMIDSLRPKCEEYLLKSISDDNVVLLYIAGLSCQSKPLSNGCIEYMLTEIANPNLYLIATAKLLRSEENRQFQEDIQSVLNSQLKLLKS